MLQKITAIKFISPLCCREKKKEQETCIVVYGFFLFFFFKNITIFLFNKIINSTDVSKLWDVSFYFYIGNQSDLETIPISLFLWMDHSSDGIHLPSLPLPKCERTHLICICTPPSTHAQCSHIPLGWVGRATRTRHYRFT